MRVAELRDILKDYPPDMEVELAIVEPVSEAAEEISVDRYDLDGVMLREENTEDGPEMTLWLIGGEESDVDQLLDALELDTGEDAPHP